MLKWGVLNPAEVALCCVFPFLAGKHWPLVLSSVHCGSSPA